VGAVWLLARTNLRRRRALVAGLVLVIGAGAAFALTTAVGARRTWTAWDRLSETTRAPHAVFSFPADADPALLERVADLPQVEAMGNFSYVPIAPAPLVPGQDASGFVPLDPVFGRELYRPLIVEGRRANPRRSDEVTINEKLRDLGIRVGQRVQLRYGFEPDVTTIGSATVVGVERGEFDLGLNSANAVVWPTYAFLQQHGVDLEIGPQPAALVRLREGPGQRVAFERAVREIYGPEAFVPPGDLLGDPVREVINVQRTAWTLLAAAAGLAVLLAAGQALLRLGGANGLDAPGLRSLGMRRSQLAAVGAAQAAAVAVPVAALAVAAGVLASGLVPSGLAKRADPDFGLRVEPVVLAVGAALVVLVLTGAGALGAWRAAGPPRLPTRPEGRLSRQGGVATMLGTRWALGRTPGPAGASARSALAAVAIGLAGVLAVLTFGASDDHLHGTPRLHGWSFDASFTVPEVHPEEIRAQLPRLLDDADVKGVAEGFVTAMVLEGEPLEVVAISQVEGTFVHPTLLEGHAARDDDEIVLGSGTLDQIGKRIGDTVTVAGNDGEARLRIVGRGVFPVLGNEGDSLHNGSIMATTAERLGLEPTAGLVLVDVRDGADPQAVMARHDPDEQSEHITAFEPRNVDNLRAVGSIPWVLALFLAVLAVAAVGHALVTSVRARRRDVAVLRTIGLVRAQAVAAVIVQASTTILAGALVGIPVGVALGRWTWTGIAEGLGVVVVPVVPLVGVAVAVVAGLVLANLAAVGPAAIAARLRPAAVLRTE
jgi:hypothetical protein